ncbi:MAG: hypothetical protein QM775_07190 [Pirellulales bacterium]
MAQAPQSAHESPRVDSVRVARRQLLTSRSTSDLPPPRVVLHLPDLNALDGVVLGPPKPIAHRRYDAAHTAAEEGGRRRGQKTREARDRDGDDDVREKSAPTPIAPTLANVLRVPLSELAPKWADATNIQRLGRLIVLLQQPKMLLAAIVAAGLQLAAILAMLTGQTPPDQTKTPNNGGTQVATAPAPSIPHTHSHGDRPIHTPASMGFGLPMMPSGGAAPPHNSPPQNVAGPSQAPALPAAQSLPGMGPNDLPGWQSAPNLAGPSFSPPVGPTGGSTSLAPSQPTAAAPGSAAVTAETLPAAATSVAKPAGRPTRARLVGTIKNTNPGGAQQ